MQAPTAVPIPGAQAPGAPPKAKMTKEQLNIEIDDFNALVDRVMKSIEKYIPKALYEQINKEQEEHDKLISFPTKVECIAEYFNDAYT